MSVGTQADQSEGSVFGEAHDLHFYVFSYLSLEDLKVASSVCKAWSSLCNNRLLWKNTFLRDVFYDESSVFGDGKTVDWKQLYKFCYSFPHFARELFKIHIASGALRKYGVVGFVYQMGSYDDQEVNTAVSHIIHKYLNACVFDDVKSLLRMKEAVQKYCLPCICIEVLQNFPTETLRLFDLGGPFNCLGNAVTAITCPAEFEYLRVPLFSQLIGGNVAIFGSDTVFTDIEPENDVRYVSRSQIFSRYSFVSVPRGIECVLGSGHTVPNNIYDIISQNTKRKHAKISHNNNSNNTNNDNNNNNNTNTTSSHPPPLSPSPASTVSSSLTLSPPPSSFTSGSLLQERREEMIYDMDGEMMLAMFAVDKVRDFLRSVIIHRMASKAVMHKEWGKEDLLEVRQKLDPFIPEFVFGIREDIFNIRPDVMLAGTPFSTPEKLKEAIFELSPIGSIVKPKMIFVKQMEYTDIVKAALPKKFRNTMYCFLQNLPINMMDPSNPTGRTLQDLIDINENFAELSVGFYLRSTLLADTLDEAVFLISSNKVMKLRRKVIFCVKDGFVIERDGIIKMATAARDIPRCGILFRKRKHD